MLTLHAIEIVMTNLHPCAHLSTNNYVIYYNIDTETGHRVLSEV